MAIEKLVDSLKLEATEEANAILAKAQDEANVILAQNEAKIEDLIASNAKKANEVGASKKSMFIQGTKLRVRNSLLEAKQVKINEVFNACVEKLESMSNEEFLEFVNSKVKSLDLTGEAEILVSAKRYDVLTSKVLRDMAKKEDCKFNILDLVKKDNIKYILCDSPFEMKDGFMIKQGDIYYNYTFEAVVSAAKVDLVREVAANLFK